MKILKIFLLILVLIIAGFVFLFFSSPTLSESEAKALTLDYMVQMYTDPQAAYTATSGVFKEEFTFEDLEEIVAIGDFDRVKDFEVTQTNISKAAYDSTRGSAVNTTKIQGNLIWMDGSIIIASFTWGLEEETWKLDDFEFFSDTYVPAVPDVEVSE